MKKFALSLMLLFGAAGFVIAGAGLYAGWQKKLDATAVVSLVAVFNCGEFEAGMSVTRDGQVHYQPDTPFSVLDEQAQKLPSGSAFMLRTNVACEHGEGTGI